MDWVLPLFPNGSGLGQSVITTVWVGIAIVCFFNLRFGFPLTGLVVPGYLVPLLIVSPTSAAVILIEAIVVYWLMRFCAQTLLERFGYAEMFGRDRFFAIILLSIFIRVIMDSLFWPMIANELKLWDISFDYASDLHSLGLVIIALAANVMWNHGFKYGVKTTVIQLLCTYIVVRFVLMPFTNFSIANLAIMYEAVASSIVAAPKAYIILVLTAFIASRANLRYGWEFNGILLPALLALQLLQPSKLLTSFIETAVILIAGGALLRFTKLKNANLEGARLLFFFFNIGFIYKLSLNYLLINYYPTVKVTDTFAFGYMLSTLLALKIYQKSALGLIIRATFQTSILGGALAILIGFLIMFVPGLFNKQTQNFPAISPDHLSIPALVSDYKGALYTASQTQFTIGQYQQNLNINRFKSAVTKLVENPKEQFKIAQNIFNELGFELQQDTRYLYIHDRSQDTLRGLFIITKQPHAQHIVTVPYPTNERLASDSATLLFEHLNSYALAMGTAKNSLQSGINIPQSPYYQAFIEALPLTEVLQIRELNKRSRKTLPTGYDRNDCQAWAYNQLPHSLNQSELSTLLACNKFAFGLSDKANLPHPNYTFSMLEIYVNNYSYTQLLAKVSLTQNSEQQFPIEHRKLTLNKAIDEFAPHISAKGSEHFSALSHKEAALWEFEILRPLYRLTDELKNRSLDQDIFNRLANINKIAHFHGYKITHFSDGLYDFLMLSPRAGTQYYQQGQGLYIIRIGNAQLLNIQVPRPLFESLTLKFAGSLYKSTNAKILLVAGAHPLASTEANVMKPTNTTSLFNVVHQSLLRYYYAKPVLNLQIRSHGAPSAIRPTALSFANTTPSDDHEELLMSLHRGLSQLGVSYERVAGQSKTRGLELGSSAQTGYEVFSTRSELAALWLASDYKQVFAVSNSALQQRFVAISTNTSVQQLQLDELRLRQWHALTSAQLTAINQLTEQYTTTQHLPALSQICEVLSQCTLNTGVITELNELVLLIKQNNHLVALFMPTRNILLNKQNYTEILKGEYRVLD
ncbi:hypothetical protein PA25_08330 [Pseudoalteromonas sp. A25]|uniref:poly-gamma-glutamate biosynthesis protein PgsC/CapC n=1 Tax=Pseudoalteromonas sp. A25 TaxID=116092 RepID=UPI001260C941|nr:poly-gamma-glutamate biosynthesis protein PgsC/CapC [Pseudoalteromonas sp. A25]BBN80848.1 hypothetical protein PA25_08330 [Pseudoalteromonas sp. A25]